MENNRLLLYWNIGKTVMEDTKREDIIFRVSNYYSYRYGLYDTFSYYNVQLMKCFYLCFPIFRHQLLQLDWKHYKLLVIISDSMKRQFYFHVCLFCMLTYQQLQICIESLLYERI